MSGTNLHGITAVHPKELNRMAWTAAQTQALHLWPWSHLNITGTSFNSTSFILTEADEVGDMKTVSNEEDDLHVHLLSSDDAPPPKSGDDGALVPICGSTPISEESEARGTSTDLHLFFPGRPGDTPCRSGSRRRLELSLRGRW